MSIISNKRNFLMGTTLALLVTCFAGGITPSFGSDNEQNELEDYEKFLKEYNEICDIDSLLDIKTEKEDIKKVLLENTDEKNEILFKENDGFEISFNPKTIGLDNEDLRGLDKINNIWDEEDVYNTEKMHNTEEDKISLDNYINNKNSIKNLIKESFWKTLNIEMGVGVPEGQCELIEGVLISQKLFEGVEVERNVTKTSFGFFSSIEKVKNLVLKDSDTRTLFKSYFVLKSLGLILNDRKDNLEKKENHEKWVNEESTWTERRLKGEWLKSLKNSVSSETHHYSSFNNVVQFSLDNKLGLTKLLIDAGDDIVEELKALKNDSFFGKFFSMLSGNSSEIKSFEDENKIREIFLKNFNNLNSDILGKAFKVFESFSNQYLDKLSDISMKENKE